MRSYDPGTQVLEAADRIYAGRGELGEDHNRRDETCLIRFLRLRAATRVVEVFYVGTNTIGLHIPDTVVVDSASVYPSNHAKIDLSAHTRLGGAALRVKEG